METEGYEELERGCKERKERCIFEVTMDDTMDYTMDDREVQVS